MSLEDAHPPDRGWADVSMLEQAVGATRSWPADFAAGLQQARSADDIVQTVQRATEALGFSHFSFASRFAGEGRLGRQIALSTAPSRLLAWYDEHAALAFDPIVSRSIASMLPFYSDEISLTVGQLSLARAANRSDIGFGLTAQQHSPGAVTLCTFTASQLSQAASREELRMRAMWLVAHIHDAVLRIYQKPPDASAHTQQPLTNRELQCLALLAKGSTAKEVSKKLGTTERTVAYYVDRARKKLRTKTTMEAFARAVRVKQANVSIQPMPLQSSHRFIELDAGNSQERYSYEAVIQAIHTAPDFRGLGRACSMAGSMAGASRFALVLQVPVEGETRQFVVASRGAYCEVAKWCAGGGANNTPSWLPTRWSGSSKGDSPEAIGVRAFSPEGTVSQLLLMGEESMIDPQLVFSLARTIHARATELALQDLEGAALTERELTCLRFAAEGNSYSDVARLVGCSARSVRYHLDSVSFKCNARNIRAAMVYFLERGLISAQRFPDKLSSSDVFWHAPVAEPS